MNRHLSITFLFVLLLTITGCGQGQQTTSTSTPISANLPADTNHELIPAPPEQIPIIYDDDGSPDGTTALMYLLSHPAVDLKAVNISYGEAHPAIYIQHIGRQLEAFGLVDIPLGYGQDSPLAGTNEFPEWLREVANNFWGLPIPNASKTYPAQAAPELMVSVINQSPTPITIFVSGPLTNVAQALRIDPEIKENIASITMMGGAVYVPGNTYDFYPEHDNKVAEWNIFSDVQAAKEVFESGIDIYLVPLDATNKVLITRQDTGLWREGGEIAELAADMYDMLLNSWNAENAAIWDLMTAVLMLKPELCDFQKLNIQVVTREGNTNGQTAIIPGEGSNIFACLEPDAEGIRQTLIEIFSSSKDVSTSSPGDTAALEPTPADTPVGQIFRDDFTDNIQTGWTWENENPTRWDILPEGWLQITGEDASLINDGQQSNLLCRDAPAGDFQITVHLSANPVMDFQQAAIYLYQNGDNFIALNRGYCSFCNTGGSGVFMDYKFSGKLGTFLARTTDTDVYLRLVSQNDTLAGYYAFEIDAWQRFGQVGNNLELPKICLGVSNLDSAGTKYMDLEGKFDYLEISLP